MKDEDDNVKSVANSSSPPPPSSSNFNASTAATLSSAFASLWRSNPTQNPSTIEPTTSAAAAPTTPSTSTISGWSSNLLGWDDGSKSSPGGKRRSRGAIPFEIGPPTDLQIGPSGASLGVKSGNVNKPNLVNRESSSSPPPTNRRRASMRRQMSGSSSTSSSDHSTRLSPSAAEELTRSLNEETTHSEFQRLATSNPVRTQSPNRKSSRGNDAYSTLSRLQSKSSNANLRNSELNGEPSPRTNSGTIAGGVKGSVRGTISSIWSPIPPSSPTKLNSSGFGSISGMKGKGNLNESGFSLGNGAGPASNWEELLEKTERLDGFVRKVVFQAGVDYQ